jgi:hypothetical protein
MPRPPRIRAALAAITLVFALVGAVPYLIGTVRTPPGSRFTGLVYNDYDQEYYLAAQRSAAENLPANRFSTERRAPGPVAELYPLIGRIGGWIGLPPLVLYHGIRILASLALPGLVYVLMRLCFPGKVVRALEATVLALFATGPGALAPGEFSWRLGGDLAVVEATTLRSATLFPHFAVAYVGLTACLIAIIVAAQGAGPKRSAVWGATGGLLLAVSHAFLLLPIGLTLAISVACMELRCRRARAPRAHLAGMFAAGVAMFVPAAPSLLALRAEMRRFEALQGTPFPSTPSDRPLTWVTVYAVILPFALFGIAARRKARDRSVSGDSGPIAFQILIVATIVDLILMFSPVTPFQRRFSEGLVIPLAALAACGLALARRARLPLFGIVAALAAIGAVRLGADARYLPDADWHMFDRISQGDAVLAGDRLAPAIPAFSSGAVYVGRSVETMHFSTKRKLREAFLADPASSALFGRLRAEGINLIVSDLSDPTFAIPSGRLPASCFQPVAAFGPLTAYRPLASCPAEPAPGP